MSFIDLTFEDAEERIREIFDAYDFENLVRQRANLSEKIKIDLPGLEAELFVRFPGYKSFIKGGRVVYDYRVDVRKHGEEFALSHANIIYELLKYLKSSQTGEADLVRSLQVLFLQGDIVGARANIGREAEIQEPRPLDVTYLQILQTAISRAHESKSYNIQTDNLGLDIAEVFAVAKAIALQEDINYPRPRFEGRRMPLARYLEAIWSATHDIERLPEVISRTLSHSRITRWDEISEWYDHLEI